MSSPSNTGRDSSAGTTAEGSEYVFPYPNATFDFVFLTSVFTHMLPTDMEHYVSEIVRVLKPNGRSLCTFLLLNDESMRFMNAGFSTPFDFKQFAKNHRVITP